MSTIPKYRVEIFWSEDDQCFVVNIPDLHYCSAHGETREEALQEIEVPLSLWIESALEEGRSRLCAN